MKIGIFDSGIGGLTVFREISKRLPSFELIYLGDTARLPYGIKSKKTVNKYSDNNVRFLKSLGCEIIVIACNTASSYSTDLLKRKYKFPIFDVLSAGVAASLESEAKRIGVIGTSSTIESNTYQRTLKKRKKSIKIIAKACPMLVPIIEQGLAKENYSKIIIKNNLALLKKSKVEALILGCTHYPIIKSHVSSILSHNVDIVDSAELTASYVRDYLINNNIIYKQKYATIKVYVSDKDRKFKFLSKNFLNHQIDTIKKIEL